MRREDAIHVLVKHQLDNLSRSEREELLLNWWSIDEQDEVFHRLPRVIQKKLKMYEEPPTEEDKEFDPLLIDALNSKYTGVRNSHIAKVFSELFNVEEDIVGEVEELHSCPCCGYRTLDKRGEYFICKVCFWEDDGTRNPMDYSYPNKMTLGEAQKNFTSLGAVSKRALDFIDPEGITKYYKD